MKLSLIDKKIVKKSLPLNGMGSADNLKLRERVLREKLIKTTA